jgi:hypothetical protein
MNKSAELQIKMQNGLKVQSRKRGLCTINHANASFAHLIVCLHNKYLVVFSKMKIPDTNFFSPFTAAIK